ncbi:MAG: DUF342 domain-containing protein, partial [Candidatus Zixiibacteriota bacterium]
MPGRQEHSVTSDDSRTSARALVKISRDKLSASIFLPRLPVGAAPVSESEIREALAAKGVVYGVIDGAIGEALKRGLTDETVEVARGDAPIAGENAQFEYLFDTNPDRSPKTEESGRIDYHEVNFVQGVSANETLMRKTPPTEGVPGRTVCGQSAPAARGRDILLPKGMNTEISEDGLELLSTTDGAISYNGGKVAVRAVVNIAGDVDFSTGNVRSPGSIKITGDVKAGFKVHAQGDIEITGSVSDAEVISEGDILIKGGFSGRGEGLVKATGSVTVQHVEGQKIIAGGSISVGGDALNARMEAGERIIVRSPKGAISGGEALADKEISAPILGSSVWSETTLRVARDSGLKGELRSIREEIERLKEDQERVKSALMGLVRLEMDGKLPAEKEESLTKLREVNREMPDNIKSMRNKESRVCARIAESERAAIVATRTIHPGVSAYFGAVYTEIKAQRGPTSLLCYSGR